MPISYVTASGRDIAELVDRIEDVVQGFSNTHVTMACIVVATLAQNPDVAPAKIELAVKAVTELLSALLVEESPTGAVN